jgi:virginiamycin B lyase
MGSWVTGSYPIPGGLGIASIAAGPDLRMWFTENDTSKVGSNTVVGRVNQIYDTGPYPFGITVGPDGNMWFCVGYDNTIGPARPR